jgi:hypothetical protein
MKKPTQEQEQPANLNEFLERAGDDFAKSQRQHWFLLCTQMIGAAIMAKREALAQMSGLPTTVIVAITCIPFLLFIIQSGLDSRQQRAKIKAEITRRELSEESRTHTLVPSSDVPRREIPNLPLGRFLKAFAYIMVRFIWTVEGLVFVLMISILWLGEIMVGRTTGP